MTNDIRKGFRYSKRFSSGEKSAISRIIGTELKKGTSQNQIVNILKEKGFSYWEKNMRYDIRRKGAILYAQSESAKTDAGEWFDKTFEIFRDKYGLTSSQANIIWQKTQEKTRMKLALANNEKEFWELYKGLF